MLCGIWEKFSANIGKDRGAKTERSCRPGRIYFRRGPLQSRRNDGSAFGAAGAGVLRLATHEPRGEHPEQRRQPGSDDQVALVDALCPWELGDPAGRWFAQRFIAAHRGIFENAPVAALYALVRAAPPEGLELASLTPEERRLFDQLVVSIYEEPELVTRLLGEDLPGVCSTAGRHTRSPSELGLD